jgi:hypothetical protein
MKDVMMMENKETKGWIIGMGTGNATCRVCGQISGQIHSNPFDCSDERQIALGFEPLGE